MKDRVVNLKINFSEWMSSSKECIETGEKGVNIRALWGTYLKRE